MVFIKVALYVGILVTDCQELFDQELPHKTLCHNHDKYRIYKLVESVSVYL